MMQSLEIECNDLWLLTHKSFTCVRKRFFHHHKRNIEYQATDYEDEGIQELDSWIIDDGSNH